MATYTDILAAELKTLGVSWGVISYWDARAERQMHAADARAADGRRWIARAESEVGALLELKAMATRGTMVGSADGDTMQR